MLKVWSSWCHIGIEMMLEMYPETNWNNRRMGGAYLIFFWWISMTNSDSCSQCCLFKERFRNCRFLYLFSSSLLKNLLLTEDGSYRTPLVLCGSSQSGHREGTQTVFQECGSIFRFVSQISTHTYSHSALTLSLVSSKTGVRGKLYVTFLHKLLP